MKKKLEVFIGPCVLESEELGFEIAEKVKNDLLEFSEDIKLVFKASFDKANRTSINSFRGPGIDQGLSILTKIKEQIDLPLLVDFHIPEQAYKVAEVADILQIPAFLCRQTDMILEGAKASKKFNRELKIKKGQFLSPHDAKNIVDKAASVLPLDKIILTERGTSFGYNTLIVDMASFQIMKSFGVRVVHDATHSVQCPGGQGNFTGGKKEQIEVLSKAAIAAGADGIFLEVHPDPVNAKSDATTCMDLKEVKEFIRKIITIYKVV